jgi:hypothetical protein
VNGSQQCLPSANRVSISKAVSKAVSRACMEDQLKLIDIQGVLAREGAYTSIIIQQGVGAQR